MRCKWDGVSSGLKDEQIPLQAKIVSVADTLMRDHRPSVPEALPLDKALEVISGLSERDMTAKWSKLDRSL